MAYSQHLKKLTFVTLLALISAEIFYFYISMLKSSVTTISIILIRDYNLTAPDLSVIVSAFYVTALVLKLPAGVIVDRYGPKYPLLIAIILSALGALMFSQSEHILMFSISRAFMAIGYSCSLLAAVKILAKYLPQRLYALLIGTTLFCGYLGASFAGYPLSKLVSIYTWDYVFISISIVGVALAILLFISLENENNQIPGEKHTLIEKIKQSFDLLKNPQIIILALFTGILLSGAVGIADLWGKLYLFEIQGIDKSTAAFVSTTMIYLGVSIGSLVWGIIQSTFHCGRLTLFWIALSATGLSTLFFLIGDNSITALGIVGFLLGALSASKVICYDLARSLVDYKNLAVVVGILAMSVTGMGAVIQLLTGYVLHVSQNIFESQDMPYHIAILTFPAVLLIAAVLALFIKPKIQITAE